VRFAYSPAAAGGAGLLTKAQKSLNQTVAAGAGVVSNCGGAVATATAAASATAAAATIANSTVAAATDTAAASVSGVVAAVRFPEFVQ